MAAGGWIRLGNQTAYQYPPLSLGEVGRRQQSEQLTKGPAMTATTMRRWLGMALLLSLMVGNNMRGWSESLRSLDDDEQAAIKAVEKLDGKVTRKDEDGKSAVVEVNLRLKEVTDKDMEKLKGLKKLQVLILIGCSQVTEKGMKELKGLTELRELRLGGDSPDGMSFSKGPEVTDEVLKELKGLTKLEKLGISQQFEVTDEGLKAIKDLKNLKELVLYNCEKVTDEGVNDLQKALPDLKIKRNPQ
jgi:hypothetical protein